MPRQIHKCFAKAIGEATPGEIVRSGKWVTSRRAWLKIYDDRVICGDWDIAYSTVSDAVLYKGWSYPWPVRVLELVVGSSAYQFGVSPWCALERHLPIEVRSVPLEMKHSTFSILIRVLAVGYLVHWLWQRYG